jgi:hypothetical protein
MSRVVLSGIDATNPLGFLASVGLLRLLGLQRPSTMVAFLTDGSYRPSFEEISASEIGPLVAADAAAPLAHESWWLSYEKQEKAGVKVVADLKAPPDVFQSYLVACIQRWANGDDDAAAYAAAFGTSIARDGKGNTKPTAFHFTAANQQFLQAVEGTRAMLTTEWIQQSLFEGHAERRGANLRWNPLADRNWALMRGNPNHEGTTVDAPLEWLAFRALPLFPTAPRGTRVMTTAVTGRGDKMKLTWPLWSTPTSLRAARSLLWVDWANSAVRTKYRDVFAVCASPIRRSNQGFGNFAPAEVTT